MVESRFNNLVRTLSKKKGVKNPKALAGWLESRK